MEESREFYPLDPRFRLDELDFPFPDTGMDDFAVVGWAHGRQIYVLDSRGRIITSFNERLSNLPYRTGFSASRGLAEFYEDTYRADFFNRAEAWERTRRVTSPPPSPSIPYIPKAHEKTAYAIWQEIIQACEAYFFRKETTWAGDSRAPEFTDEQVNAQFEDWDKYRDDAGAMNWGGAQNAGRPNAFVFTALPQGMKRAVCERVWVICSESKLGDDEDFQRAHEDFRRRQEIAKETLKNLDTEGDPM